MKKMLGLSILLIAIFACFITASASSYKSTLSLGAKNSLFGATREYTAGTHKIVIPVGVSAGPRGKPHDRLRVNLERDYGTYCWQVGTNLFEYYYNAGNVTLIKTWSGSQPAGNYYYYFSTDINGVAGGSIYSGNVSMTS